MRHHRELGEAPGHRGEEQNLGGGTRGAPASAVLRG